MAVLILLLWIATLAIVVNLTMLALECIAACASRSRPTEVSVELMPRTVVLIPAHNEARGLPRTLESVCKQTNADIQCLVVADNCNDDTAEVAARFPVTVLKRKNSSLRGKGYALDFGLNHLKQNAPEVVIFIDADCEVAPNSLGMLAKSAHRMQRPVQGGNTLDSPENASFRNRISSFAFYFKNHIRPLGLTAIAGSSPLFGTGMAIPWNALQRVSLGSSNIVEDLQLGIDLAIEGYPTQYLPEPCVRGTLPSSEKLALTQRGRWEQGHIHTLLTQAPSLFWNGLRQRRLSLILQAFDLGVFPLSFLAILTLLTWIVHAICCVFGGASPAGLILMSSVILLGIFSFSAAWWRFGRSQIQLKEILLAPAYVLWKIPMYVSLFLRPQKGWVSLNRWH